MYVFVHAKNIISCFFSVPRQIPLPSEESCISGNTESGNIPVAWGKSITLACSLYRTEFGSNTIEGVPLTSLSLSDKSTLLPTLQ